MEGATLVRVLFQHAGGYNKCDLFPGDSDVCLLPSALRLGPLYCVLEDREEVQATPTPISLGDELPVLGWE